MTKAFVSWSGGKESCNAYFKASSKEFDVSHLLNMVTTDGKVSMTNRISSELLHAQAEAVGTKLIQRRTTWQNYERDFKKALSMLSKEGVITGVFGDIAIQDHRAWVERVCKEVDLKPVLPLWGMPCKKLLEEFVTIGFEAVLISADSKLFGKEWLGRKIDRNFIKYLSRIDKIDLCGEQGEYHTFVVNGPIFKKRIKLFQGNRILKDGYWFLEIPEYELCIK